MNIEQQIEALQAQLDTLREQCKQKPEIAFDEERGIADKQLVECRYNAYPYVRHLRFYDAVNRCTFSAIGNRGGGEADNYRPIPYAEYPDWATEAERTLED
jgi:hypothetical protein